MASVEPIGQGQSGTGVQSATAKVTHVLLLTTLCRLCIDKDLVNLHLSSVEHRDAFQLASKSSNSYGNGVALDTLSKVLSAEIKHLCSLKSKSNLWSQVVVNTTRLYLSPMAAVLQQTSQDREFLNRLRAFGLDPLIDAYLTSIATSDGAKIGGVSFPILASSIRDTGQ